MSSADIFLEIARHHLEELKSTVPPVSSDLALRHALVCSVFAAVAVEHALAELVWVRAFFQTPLKYRRVAIQRAAAAQSIPSKLEFVRATSALPEPILANIRELSKYRNGLVHAQITPVEGKALDFEAMEAIEEAGLGSAFDEASGRAMEDGDSSALDEFKESYGNYYRSLNLGGLGTPDLDAALRNYEIAKEAVPALMAEFSSEDWPVQVDEPAAN